MLAKSDGGFTLIELMITIVIIGLLAAIGLPNFVSLQDRAREGEVKSNARLVAVVAEDVCILNNGVYPTAIAPMQAMLPGAALLRNPFTKALTEPTLGNAPTPGEIRYEAQMANGVAEGYVIYGGAADGGIAITLSNGN